MTAILAVLKAMPVRYWALGSVFIALLVFAGTQSHRLGTAQVQLADEKVVTAQLRVQYAAAAASASETYRGIEGQRNADKQEIQHDALDQTARLAADRSRYDDVSARLRDARAAFAACSRPAPTDPRAVAPGPAASSATDLLAFVQGRIDRAESEVADFADTSSIAGTACERSYDSLTAKTGK